MNDATPSSFRHIVLVMPWVLFFMFIQLSNDAIIQLLAPSMTDIFGVTKVQVSILTTTAMIISGLGGVIVLVLTERYSMRQLYVFGSIVFAIGTVAGFLLSHWFVWLAVARLLQCIGATSVMGCFMILVTRYAPEDKKSIYFAVSSAMFLLSSGLGVLIGSLITNYISWRYALLLPLITIVALPPFVRHMPREKGDAGKFDFKGAILASVGIISLLLTITLQNVYCFVSAVLFLSIYILYSRRHSAPFLDLRLLKLRGLRPAFLSAFMMFGIQGTILFMLPFVMKEIYRLEIIQVGLLFLTAHAPAVISAVLTRKIVDRYGREKTFYLGWSLFFASIVIIAFAVGGPLYFVWFGMFVFAISNPFIYTGLVTSVTSILPAKRLGATMGLYTLSVGCGNSVFISTMSLMLTKRTVDFHVIPFVFKHHEANMYGNAYVILAMLFIAVLLLYQYVFRRKNNEFRVKALGID